MVYGFKTHHTWMPRTFFNCSHFKPIKLWTNEWTKWTGQQSSSVKLIWLENDMSMRHSHTHCSGVGKTKGRKVQMEKRKSAVRHRPDHEKSLNDDAGCLHFRNGFIYLFSILNFLRETPNMWKLQKERMEKMVAT